MFVIKRDSSRVPVRYDEITDRVSSLCFDLEGVDAAEVAHNVIMKLVSGIRTSELDKIAAAECMNLVWKSPDYSLLAGRLVAADLQKTIVSRTFSDAVRDLVADGQLHADMLVNADGVNDFIRPERDFLFDYFGMSTLVNGGYLKKIDGKIVETPQYLFMRVALAIHGADLGAVRETYDAMSLKKCVHATPTLFHAGTLRPQMASCYLMQVEDSITGMYDIVHKCALVSKYGGGIGIALHKIRSAGATINTSRGVSSGLLPYIRVLDSVARHVDQGGKRPGAIAVYLEPWHPDIVQFVRARNPSTVPDERAANLNYALWTNDLFMERVASNGPWSLFCPGEFPELVDLVGDAFKTRYLELEAAGRAKKTMPAMELWTLVLRSQMETGMPYVLFKDACNLKSNQKNLGTIQSSNLCAEILEYTSADETAVCNLASLALPSFYTDGDFDFEELGRVVRMLVRNLNKSIDKMFYTTSCTQRSNARHRPIGIGVQGYADLFARVGVAWESAEAVAWTKAISACIYYHALDESCRLTESHGPYESFEGSPASRGELQFDLWGVDPVEGHDWDGLREHIRAHGLRNSLCVALMPTASTSNILGFNESFEPFTYNLYTRRTLAGEFVLLNKYLVKELIRRGMWDRETYELLIASRGSIQSFEEIPADLKALYKTAREIRRVKLLELAAARGPYVCQTQSMNLYVDGKATDFQLLHNCHMKSWTLGLKTAAYYTHSAPASTAANVVSRTTPTTQTAPTASAAPTEPCESCSA